MVEWEDAKLLAPGGYARVHRLNDGSYMAVYSSGGSGCFKISKDGCSTWSEAQTAMAYNSYIAPVQVNVSNTEFAQLSSKSFQGRELKALELPGLWNGAMSDWNTQFVEVPLETFNPVKVVLDLLRPAHQG